MIPRSLKVPRRRNRWICIKYISLIVFADVMFFCHSFTSTD